MHTWQLQEAKQKLSQVVDLALNDGPQIITRHGVEVAVLLSCEQYQALVARQEKLSDFFQRSPLVGADLDLSRDPSPLRDEFQP